MEFVLTDADFEKVRQGYGCSFCLEDFRGVWMARCPQCGTEGFAGFDVPKNDSSFRVAKRA